VTKITVELSADGFRKAARAVERYRQRLKKNIERLVEAMCKEGEFYAINRLEHVDTGETLESIRGYRNGNKGVIMAGGNAIWIEFGTGVRKNSGNPPHPLASELGMSPWGTYGEGHGAQWDGWYYPGDDGKIHFSTGMEGNQFMYLTAQLLKERYPDMAKEIFND